MPATERMLPCPVCQQIMTIEAFGETHIDVCELHGVWLDQTELVRVTEHARDKSETTPWEDFFRKRVRPEVNHDRVLLCPISGTQMKIESYHGVHIDWSPGEGVWLDNGELDAIINNLRLDEQYMRGIALRLNDGRF